MIVSITTRTFGHLTCVDVVSSLAGLVYYHWFVHGAWVGRTTAPTRCFSAEPGEQLLIDIQDTLLDAYDPIANAPAGYPPRVSFEWTRSLSTDTAHYLLESNRAAAGWITQGRILVVPNRWTYQSTTVPLDDLISYAFRVTPYDKAGNAGTAISVAAQTLVRTPDGPNFAAAFNGTNMVMVAI